MTDQLPICIIGDEEFECCPHCLNADPSQEIPLRNVYENNGFQEQPHWEVIAMECPNCGTRY